MYGVIRKFFRIVARDGGRCGIDKWHAKELQRQLRSKV